MLSATLPMFLNSSRAISRRRCLGFRSRRMYRSSLAIVMACLIGEQPILPNSNVARPIFRLLNNYVRRYDVDRPAGSADLLLDNRQEQTHADKNHRYSSAYYFIGYRA